MAEYSAIYEDAIDRITSVYASCSKAEQKLLMDILTEMSQTGYSYTLEKVWLSDYREIPVGIDIFLNDPYYLGETNNFGENIYPFWRTMMNEVFNAGNQYNEIILSGATRIGKTSTAVTMMAYMLYKLMLYRNPHQYFSKKAISKFTLGFANLTKELATSVGFREFNDTLRAVPWFMDHGSVTRSDRNFYYLPEGDKIEIIPASDGAQLLGKQLWACLTGDTKILTTDGIKEIRDCEDSFQEVIQYVDGQFIPVVAEIKCTRRVTTTIKIELEDGTILEGTPDHLVMLSDGTYKALGELTSSDDLQTFNISKEVDEMNLKDPNIRFKVYVHTSPKGKKYVGITCQTTEQRWQKGGAGYKENKHFWNAIQKYGWDNFTHEVVADGLSLEDACEMECKLISGYDSMNPDKGYNHTTGGNWSSPDEETRKRLSRAIRRSRTPEVIAKLSKSLMGHIVSAETRRKLSVMKSGVPLNLSDFERKRRREYRPTEETIKKLRNTSGWCKGLTKYTDERVMKISRALTGLERTPEWKSNLSNARKAQYENGYSPIWINNGEIETSIQKGACIPEGFSLGRLKILDTYIYKDGASKKISHLDLDKYVEEGWIKGRPSSVGDSIRKSLQRMHWEYEGLRFEKAADLAYYLRQNGYPRITESTITYLSRKGFDKSPSYHSLHGKVQCIHHEDKVNSSN